MAVDPWLGSSHGCRAKKATIPTQTMSNPLASGAQMISGVA
jgi:hypothetical protein